MQMKKLHRRINTAFGFTLVETLLAIMILLMVSAVVATGIPAAKNAYEKVVLASDAEVLLSTTISTLRNELGTSQAVDTTEAQTGAETGTTITYYNPSRGATSRIYVEGDTIKFQRYYFDSSAYSMDYDVPDPEQLISSAAITDNLSVKYKHVSYNSGIITFEELKVYHGETELVRRGDYGTLSIRVICDWQEEE